MRTICVLSLAILVGIMGCAKRVHVKSIPPGAAVVYRGEVQGATPMTLRVPRRDLRHGPANVTLELAGHAPATVELEERVAVRRVIGSIFSLGLPLMFHGFTRFAPVGPVALAPLPATPTTASDDLPTRLRRLDQLRADGLIDEQVYRESRAELLRRDIMAPQR